MTCNKSDSFLCFTQVTLHCTSWCFFLYREGCVSQSWVVFFVLFGVRVWGGGDEDSQLPLLNNSEDTAWHESNHNTMADSELPTHSLVYWLCVYMFVCVFGLCWMQSRVYNTAAVYAGSWMVDMLERRASGQLGRDHVCECPNNHSLALNLLSFGGCSFVWFTVSRDDPFTSIKPVLLLKSVNEKLVNVWALCYAIMLFGMVAVMNRKLRQAQQTWYGNRRHGWWFQMIVYPLIWAKIPMVLLYFVLFCYSLSPAKVSDDKLLGLFLKHSQWPPKAFALPGLRANAASKPSLDIWDFWRWGLCGAMITKVSALLRGDPMKYTNTIWLNFLTWAS